LSVHAARDFGMQVQPERRGGELPTVRDHTFARIVLAMSMKRASL
jgi:hypothetical protein